jgi:hypothetical protein
MAVTINAEKSSPDANSYTDIATADSIFNTFYLANDWFQLEDDDKARLLITATRELDGLPYLYEKYDSSQALKFPRKNDNDLEIGWSEMQLACAYQALFLYFNFETIRDSISESIQNIETQVIGKLRVTKTNSKFNPLEGIDRQALRLLAGYLNFDTVVHRG